MMAFNPAYPTFRTPDLARARLVARNLVEARQGTPRALFPHEVTSWVAQRFPALSELEKIKLVVEVTQWVDPEGNLGKQL